MWSLTGATFCPSGVHALTTARSPDPAGSHQESLLVLVNAASWAPPWAPCSAFVDLGWAEEFVFFLHLP